MASISHKTSTVSGRVPDPAVLAKGEIAVNLADRKLWTKDHTGAVVELGSPGGGLAASGSVPPANPAAGQIWMDTTVPGTPALKVWDGTAWILAGAEGEKGDPGQAGPASTVPGPKGDKGDKGDAGGGVTIVGTLDATNALPATLKAGDMFIAGSTTPAAGWPGGLTPAAGSGLVYDGAAWNDVGSVRGPVGPAGADSAVAGPKGDKGDPGLDGNDGADGADAVDGKDGLDGNEGPAGNDGAPGLKGDQGIPGPTEIATATVLGGVKIGANIAVTADGTISSAAAAPPDATTTVKGVVEIADAADITAGTAGASAVVDAAQLKAASEKEMADIIDYTDANTVSGMVTAVGAVTSVTGLPRSGRFLVKPTSQGGGAGTGLEIDVTVAYVPAVAAVVDAGGAVTTAATPATTSVTAVVVSPGTGYTAGQVVDIPVNALGRYASAGTITVTTVADGVKTPEGPAITRNPAIAAGTAGAYELTQATAASRATADALQPSDMVVITRGAEEFRVPWATLVATALKDAGIDIPSSSEEEYEEVVAEIDIPAGQVVNFRFEGGWQQPLPMVAVDWGDGSAVEKQTVAVMSHTYAAGVTKATIRALNVSGAPQVMWAFDPPRVIAQHIDCSKAKDTNVVVESRAKAVQVNSATGPFATYGTVLNGGMACLTPDCKTAGLASTNISSAVPDSSYYTGIGPCAVPPLVWNDLTDASHMFKDFITPFSLAEGFKTPVVEEITGFMKSSAIVTDGMIPDSWWRNLLHLQYADEPFSDGSTFNVPDGTVLPELIEAARTFYIWKNPIGRLPESLWFSLVKLQNAQEMFKGSTLRIIPEGVTFPALTTARAMFRQSQVARVPQSFANAFPKLTDATEMFAGCPGTAWPDGCSFPELVTADQMFLWGSVSPFPSGLLMPKLTSAKGMFASGWLDVIPSGVVFPALTNAEEMFSDCKQLVTLPDTNMFPAVANGNKMFQKCGMLTGLPAAMTFPALTSASGMFLECDSLVTGPSSLTFANAIDVSELFKGCPALTTLPATYDFSKVTNARSMFEGAPKLETLPAGINFTSVQDASGMFSRRWTTATFTMPAGVTMPAITNGKDMLADQLLATVTWPAGVFDGIGARAVDFTNAFVWGGPTPLLSYQNLLASLAASQLTGSAIGIRVNGTNNWQADATCTGHIATLTGRGNTVVAIPL